MFLILSLTIVFQNIIGRLEKIWGPRALIVAIGPLNMLKVVLTRSRIRSTLTVKRTLYGQASN
jgi:hypothetical protein